MDETTKGQVAGVTGVRVWIAMMAVVTLSGLGLFVLGLVTLFSEKPDLGFVWLLIGGVELAVVVRECLR